MAIQCNIDHRGKLIRLIAGAMLDTTGLGLLAFRFVGVLSGDWPWFVGGAAAVVGMFLVLEGVLGWCVVRALGVKTPV